MLPEYKSKANMFILIGLALEFGSLALPGPVGLLALLAGVGVFIFGCSNYAMAKGHSGVLGILGFLNILGLIALILLPDKHK